MSESPKGQSRFRTGAVILFYTLMGAAGVVLAKVGLSGSALEPYPHRAGSSLRDLALGIGVGLAVVILSQLMDRYFAWSRALNDQIKQLLGPITVNDAFLLAALSSIGEELFFRGMLLPAVGLIPSSIIFGLSHGLHISSPNQMWQTMKRFFPLVVAATAMGFAFGWMVEYTGNVLGPVVAHFTINFLNLRQMYRTTTSTGRDDGHG